MAEPESEYAQEIAARQREWATAQAKAEANLKALHAQIAAMPDVKHAPDVGALWSLPGVACTVCGGEGFKVQRFVTVNGYAHRIETCCLGCQDVATWDFNTKSWID